ncbi:INPP phosphatase, partial [Rhinopomastus cyanomelas]|nr:INPP phosphatase [Rhinopomastus cyanomelas]
NPTVPPTLHPTDSTHEYIEGREEVPPVGGIAPGGLCTALVLIGVYERHSGCPVLGVINEPFHRRDPNTGRYLRGEPHHPSLTP